MSVHAGHDHSSVLLTGTTQDGNEGDSGDISSFRMLSRRPGSSSGGCEAESPEGDGLEVWLTNTSGGGTSLRLQGTGLLYPEGGVLISGDSVCGCEASTGKHSPPVDMASDGTPAAASGGCAPVGLLSSGWRKASAGICGRDSLRGPPQAEQDMEVGVFCRVQREHSQTRLLSTASPVRSIWDGLREPEQLLERRGCPSDEPRGRSTAPV